MRQIGPLTTTTNQIRYLYTCFYALIEFYSLLYAQSVQRSSYMCADRSMRTITIISLDRTNNLLFRFIDLVPSVQSRFRTLDQRRMNTASNEKKTQFFDAPSVLFVYFVAFLCSGLCKSVL